MKTLAAVLAGLNVVNLLGGAALGVVFAHPIRQIVGSVFAWIGAKVKI